MRMVSISVPVDLLANIQDVRNRLNYDQISDSYIVFTALMRYHNDLTDDLAAIRSIPFAQ